MSNTTNKECSFCKVKESSYNPFIAGSTPGVYICKNCVTYIHKTLTEYMMESEKEGEKNSTDIVVLSPKELKAKLDEYVVGQDEAKRVFSVAVYNHYKRIIKGEEQVSQTLRDVEVSKSNILLISANVFGCSSINPYLNINTKISLSLKLE